MVTVNGCLQQIKWPEVHMMESTTTELLIKHLQQIFAVHGIPLQVVAIR